MKPINVLSYGGGVNSSALFFHIVNKGMPLDIVIFSDTGEETLQTYDAVARMRRECKKRSIPFKVVRSHHGNLYDYYMKHKAVMSVMRRDCTGKFKVSPIRKYLREEYGKKATFVMYIGIASDEYTRMRDSNVKYITNSYPFVDDKINREGNKRILKENGFVASKSGCKGCMYIKRKAWIKMLIHDPVEFARHKALEMNNSRYPELWISPNFSLVELEKRYVNQGSLLDFEDLEPSCDVSGSCFL